jgi:hypothetical protein
MSRSGLSKLGIMGGIVLSLSWVDSASGQSAQPPDLSGGEGGWVHPRGTGFQPVPGSPSPVRQDRGHPFTPGRGTAWRIGDLSNPNLKPWVKELMKKDTEEIDAGKIAFQPSSSCLPAGIPNMLSSPAPLLILQAPKEVVMIKQGGNEIRHIYLDVPHSASPKPSWSGESVGHYEGDTLVVDTIGQNTKTVLDIYRTPHTEKLHVVERWRTIDGGNGLEVNVTVDDPEAFYQPWSTRVRDQRGKESFIAEEICAENNLNFGLFDFHMPVATKPDF